MKEDERPAAAVDLVGQLDSVDGGEAERGGDCSHEAPLAGRGRVSSLPCPRVSSLNERVRACDPLGHVRGLIPGILEPDDQAGDSARLTSWTIQPLPSGSLNERNEL
jgi:hypothetical protein